MRTTQPADRSAGRLVDALARLPMPDAPATRPWDFSASAFLGPHLPGSLRRMPKLLDRLGALQLGPAAIRIDGHGDVAWSDVVEVRTHSLFDVLGDAFVEDLRRRSTDLVPPGLGRPARWTSDKVSELVLSIFLLALPDAPNQGVPDVPAEVVYRDRRRRPQSMTPGLVAGALLTLPAVRQSVLATARSHGIAVVPHDRSAVLAAAGGGAAALAERRAALLAQLERLGGGWAPAGDLPIEESERRQKGPTVGLFSRTKPSSGVRLTPQRPFLGQGRSLWSRDGIEGCLETVGAALLRLREPQYAEMPPFFAPGWTWHGEEADRPDAAVVCFDEKKDFLFVALRSDASGTAITLIPLELGDEQSTVGMWKQLDPSLTSRGLTLRGLVTLEPPPVPDDLVLGMLAVTGHPATPHNVDVLSSMVTRQFATKAYQFISHSDEAAGWRFVDQHAYRSGLGLSVARQILADLADRDPQLLPYFQDLPMRVRAIMLEARAGQGTFWDELHR